MIAVELDGVGKRFRIGAQGKRTMLSRLVSAVSGREPKVALWGVRGVSLKLRKGEILGVVGSNGSGKSTLLRLVAGIYSPDEGSVKCRGKVVSLIDLKAGLQGRLTMRENISLCCSLFGLSRQDAGRALPEIVEFSGLGDFLETKIYQFSEGMKQRLSFSIAIHCRPGILLLDEVFEIGDEDFKKRSATKIRELVDRGLSVFWVSHELWMVKKYCDRVAWIDGGFLRSVGDTGRVVSEYERSS